MGVPIYYILAYVSVHPCSLGKCSTTNPHAVHLDATSIIPIRLV